MTTLDTSRYGYPLATNYGIVSDLALMRTEYESGWRRQRRTYLHNASAITLSWRLSTREAKSLNDWLQAQPVGDFFYCDLLTGNNSESNSQNIIEPVLIRRISPVSTSRTPYVDAFELTFQAETQTQGNYQSHASDAADKPPMNYPTNLPIPMCTSFGSEQGTRNISAYSLSYRMNTVTLSKWLEFAGFAGTAWFYTYMVSVTMPCGLELIRFISAPTQTLESPDMWVVSVQAEAMPAFTTTYYVLPPTVECTYDSNVNYDDEFENYDCGGVPPSQGEFTMVLGVPRIYAVANADATIATSTIVVKFLRTGEIVADPLFNTPAWLTWHSDPYYLARPAIACNVVCEFSIDEGVTWQYMSPVPGGVWLSLKGQDVWFRLVNESSTSHVEHLNGTFYFEENKLPTVTVTQQASDYSGIKTYFSWEAENIVTNPVYGPKFNAVFNYSIDSTRKVLPTSPLSIGLDFESYGMVTRPFGGGTGALSWHDVPAIGVGNGLWIILTTVSAVGATFPTTGVRVPLSATVYIRVTSNIAQPADTELLAEWIGTYEIYNAAVGGALVGDGSITLHYLLLEQP